MAKMRKSLKAAILRISPQTAPLIRLVSSVRERWILAKARGRLAKPVPSRPAPHSLPGRLVVSFTSFPPRYETLPLTVEALLRQTCKPDEIVLWLAESDMAAITPSIRNLCERGLTIRQCPRDLKSGNKLLHALSTYGGCFIVTCDDDIYYPPKWLETLVRSYKADIPEVIGTRAHVAEFTADGRAKPYNSWVNETSLTSSPGPGKELFLTGIGGILYPPNCMDSRVTDLDDFLALCPRADDIWFFVMQELAGTPRKRTKESFEFLCWPNSQTVSLMSFNVDQSANDHQMAAVENAYPELIALRKATINAALLTKSDC